MKTDDINERGEEIYKQRLRDLLETEENIGKLVSIDVDTGDYEVDADLLASGLRLQARRPQARMYGKRIGYDAVYAIGGSIHRTAK